MNTRQISFPIQGMFCARCAVDLERALARRDGVIGACVNYASERATVTYDPARLNPTMFVSIVSSAGFTTSLEQELATKAHESHHLRKQPRWLMPTLTGFGGGVALVVLYLAILALSQSVSHALEQLSQDRLWVGLVALGFGVQVGLFVYLRLIISAMQLAGVTAITGTGTGTSTLGMIACCAHHFADIAPVVAFTGATGLSGVIAFLAAYKIPFIVFGLAINAVGVVMSVRTIRRERMHLKLMERAMTPPASPLAACH